MILSLASTSNALIDSTGISISGGTITVNKSGAQTEQVSDTADITFNGSGTYQQTNGSSGPFTEILDAVTVSSGQASFNYTNGASSGGVVTTLTSLSRSVNTAAVTFSNANAAQTSFRVSGAADTAADEIIGPWATYGTSVAIQTDYAIHTGANGTVAAPQHRLQRGIHLVHDPCAHEQLHHGRLRDALRRNAAASPATSTLCGMAPPPLPPPTRAASISRLWGTPLKMVTWSGPAAPAV